MVLLFFALFSLFSQPIDLYVSGLFYSPEHGFYNDFFFQFLFKYGEHFGLATGILAACAFLLSWVRPQWKKWRRGSLLMVLTLVVGAGLLTNTLFKGHWGRPRPKQIVEFGGKHLYRPFWNPDFDKERDPQKSFPSGHVAMGFYFLSFCFVGRRYQSKLLFRIGLFLTLFLGGGLMIGRVVQGAHFVSDVFASAVLMWYVVRLLDRVTWGGWELRALPSTKPGTSQGPDVL